MYAVEFEADLTSEYLKLKDYDKLANKHARIIILVDENQDETDMTKTLNDQVETESLKSKALKYADQHPVFPLNWSENKLSREEMNAR